MSLIYILDLIGTFVFAISGALVAAEKKLDVFGASVIAFVTAVGGGTIRDVLIGSLPVGWMKDLNYLVMIGLGVLSAILFKKYILKLGKTMFLFDTIGIALFTILGLEKTLDLGLSPIIAVMMGTVSAVFGGVIRDILTNRVPLIFRKEFYASACIIGATCYLLLGLTFLGNDFKILFTVLLIIFIRVFAVKRKWSLPTLS